MSLKRHLCPNKPQSLPQSKQQRTASPQHEHDLIQLDDVLRKRNVFIDALNVLHWRYNVMHRSRGDPFFCMKDLKLTVDYFIEHGHPVKIYMPFPSAVFHKKMNTQPGFEEENYKIYKELKDRRDPVTGKEIVTHTSSRPGYYGSDGVQHTRRETAYDDWWIVEAAALSDGMIVSRDSYHDLLANNGLETEQDRKRRETTITKRRIHYHFTDSRFVPHNLTEELSLCKERPEMTESALLAKLKSSTGQTSGCGTATAALQLWQGPLTTLPVDINSSPSVVDRDDADLSPLMSTLSLTPVDDPVDPFCMSPSPPVSRRQPTIISAAPHQDSALPYVPDPVAAPNLHARFAIARANHKPPPRPTKIRQQQGSVLATPSPMNRHTAKSNAVEVVEVQQKRTSSSRTRSNNDSEIDMQVFDSKLEYLVGMGIDPFHALNTLRDNPNVDINEVAARALGL